MASGLVHLVRNLLFRGHLLIPCAKHAWPWSDGIALYLLTLKKKKNPSNILELISFRGF